MIQGLSKHTKLADESGRELPALTVFSRSIEALKTHLYEILANRSIRVEPTDIKWVLTVPAIWDDAAKEFMREAAEQVYMGKTFSYTY